MSYREKLFNPLEKKSEQQIIAQRLRQDYGLIGDKVIEILSGDLLTWLKELNIDAHTPVVERLTDSAEAL